MDCITETDKAWLAELEVNSKNIVFKLDTGAAVTAIPLELAGGVGVIAPADRVLRGAGAHQLDVRGMIEVQLKSKNKCVTQKVYVIDGLIMPLLGKPAIRALDLVRVVGTVEESGVFAPGEDSSSEGVLAPSPENKRWRAKFPELFNGLGMLETEVDIQLKPDCTPFVQSIPRRVAAARREPLKLELERMSKLGVIERVDEPTEWCSPCIVVPKHNGKIRVCVDFTKLNVAVKRELHPLPVIEETLARLSGAKVFSKLDANSGYWQMRLRPEAQKLTTFITPFGRYLCKRLPFGISSAPEIFQREMQRILGDSEGVVCHMDDVLVFGKDEVEHDMRLEKVLKYLREAGLTLNKDKCEFKLPEVKFVGHVISAEGIKPDPDKTKAIMNFPVPVCKKDLRRFFGIVNYLGRFTPEIASRSAGLRKLLSKDAVWMWSKELEGEFESLKRTISNETTLTQFDMNKETMLSADASASGIGAALMQREEEGWRPIAYASRALSPAEVKYAQIEKEALAICWGCHKFDYFLAGRQFQVETDHKPLVSVLGEKELASLPLRVQRFRLKMMAYSYSIKYTPGVKLVLADALSRAPVDGCGKRTGDSLWVSELLDSLPISQRRCERLRAALLEDAEGMALMDYTSHGWPSIAKLDPVAKRFYAFRNDLTVVGGLVMFNNRVFIPKLERERVLEDIHLGHQGETKCIQRASKVVWWPGMVRDVRERVRLCAKCREFRVQSREPLVSTPLPERPWWRLAMDICEKDGRKYLVVVDYFSRYITVHELSQGCTTEQIVDKLEGLFSLLGVPHSIFSDNGPSFVSEGMHAFFERLDIVHITSSPRYPQSNGEAERAVQTVKNLMKKNLNLRMALCAYRDSPLACGYSPAELLFGRSMNSMGICGKVRVDGAKLKDHEERSRANREQWYNRRHRVRVADPMSTGDKVVLPGPGEPVKANVVTCRGREVLVQSDEGALLRRNRIQLRPDSSPDVGSGGGDETKEPGDKRIFRRGVLAPRAELDEPDEVVKHPQEPTSPRMSSADQYVAAPPRAEKGYAAAQGETSSGRQAYVTRAGRKSKPPSRLHL
jgi:transposase InsO family protein